MAALAAMALLPMEMAAAVLDTMFMRLGGGTLKHIAALAVLETAQEKTALLEVTLARSAVVVVALARMVALVEMAATGCNRQ